MRYAELLENDTNDVRVVVDLIKKECQPFLTQVKNKPLWRGLRDDGGQGVGLKNARLDGRRPESTGAEAHQILNTFFARRYGHPYRNGVFASGMRAQAQDYSPDGEAYMIFPVGEFDFIWHPDIYDMYGDVISRGETDRGFELWGSFATEFNINPVEDEDAYMQFIETAGLADFLNWLHFNNPFQTTNLSAAIKSENEITIWTEKYYYLSAAIGQEVFKG